MKEQYSILKEILIYHPDTGNTYYSTGELLTLTEDLFCYIYTKDKKIKLKYSNLVWYLVYGIKPNNKQKVHYKDLNPKNFKLNNLVLVSNATYFKIKENIYNLHKGLRIYPHKKDSFLTILEYKDKGRVKRERYYDLGTAQKNMLKHQHRMLKYLGEYVITE